MNMIEHRITIRLTRQAAAEHVGVTTTRLVRYERLGLVSPALEGRQPVYGPNELARLRKIRRLTEDLGVNLAGVEIILRLLDQLDQRAGQDTP